MGEWAGLLLFSGKCKCDRLILCRALPLVLVYPQIDCPDVFVEIIRASDFPRSRKSRGIRGIADLKRNP